MALADHHDLPFANGAAADADSYTLCHRLQIVSSNVTSSPVALSNPHDNLLGGVTAVAMNLTGKSP